MNRPILCNDIHSKLNPTYVSDILFPRNENEVVAAVLRAEKEGKTLSICGGRHAMGGQQFGENTILLDMTKLANVGHLDRQSGTVETGAGICWPALIEALHAQQENEKVVWSIRQKQTGTDNLSLGGALAANIHGRGLHMAPLIADVAAFRLVDAEGAVHQCSRTENDQLFALAIGGYGCFGVITSVTLRLSPRIKLRRIVEVTTLDRLPAAVSDRIAKGCLYGDFQFSIDENSEDFLWKGVFSTYRPIEEDLPIPDFQEKLSPARWENLIHLAHHDRANAFDAYSKFYLSTNGNLYWSDTHQLSIYLDDYHSKLDPAGCPASEMITELYVPHDALIPFMKQAAALLRKNCLPVIYGTMRLIRRDTESALPWAKKDFACIIFNLHTEHNEQGIALAKETFRALIDLALSHSGSYFLTYHRWATAQQISAAYPNFENFLQQKLQHDPSQRFQSEWWRHYRDLFEICGPSA